MLKYIDFCKLHPTLHKVGHFAAIFFSALFVIFMYLALVGVSVDASGMRGKISTLLAKNMGREVSFDGPMQLEISAHPKLKIGGMHIANAQDFTGGDFVSLGEARLALDLWPLLRFRFQIEELAGSNVHIRLQLKKNGDVNWLLIPSALKLPEEHTKIQPAENGLQSVIARLDIKRVLLENLDVEFINANEKSHYFELQSLVAQLPAKEPIKLTLNGKIEKKHPYQLDFTGGSISDLALFDQPWPIDLKLGFMSSQLTLNGTLSDNNSNINFSLGTQNLSEFEQLLQTGLPAVGKANVSGVLKYATGKLELDKLSGHMGKTTLEGALQFDFGGIRPKVIGELTLPMLDLRPFMADKPVTDEAPPKGLAELYREIAKATFSLSALNEMDANLTLRVGEWLNLPGAVHDAMLQVKLEQGRLSIPIQVGVSDVQLSGSATADARVKPARFKLVLGAHNSRLGNLAGLLLGVPDVKGRLGNFDLRMEARGDRGLALMKSLEVQFNVAQGDLSYGNGPGERPVQFSLDKLVFTLPAGKSLQGELRGSLLEKKFRASLKGGELASLMKDAPVPLDFDLQAGTATVQIHAVMQAAAENAKSDVSFELAAPHSAEIAAWLGLKPGVDVPVSFKGKFNAESSSWHLSDFSLKLGNSGLAADVLQTLNNGRSLITLKLSGEMLDVDQLQKLLPEATKQTPSETSLAVNMIDIPILPSGISLADADISVSVKRITSSSALVVRDVRFDGHIRDGMMPISPFSANVAENNFTGAMSLDLRTLQPNVLIWVAADELDIGTVLKKIGLSSNLDARIDHASFQLNLHSSHLGELLAQSELLASFEGGHFVLTDANTDGKMNVALNKGELKSEAGAPVKLEMQGTLNNAPVFIAIHTAKAADLINPGLPLPFDFNASTSGATIKLSGDIARPFSKQGLTLALDMSGSRFDNLNTLVQTSLPPWGPWSASGKFKMSTSGYEVSALHLQVGTSQLTGYGMLDMKAVPPRLDVELTAPSIQLDDFKLGGWSLEKERPHIQEKSSEKEELSQKASKASHQAQLILSPEVLSRQNVYLTVKVDQVVSGQDQLGNGKLVAQLDNGRASLGPVVVKTPGGAASFLMKYEPGKKDVLVNLVAEMKNFDYGILARRIDHNSEMKGVVSLDIDVNARTQYLSDIFKYGKGRIDFSVWPENLKSGLLDIWAVNVLMAILPVVDSSNQSKVNCAIGKFVLADGKLTDQSILIDTSRMRVKGSGGADFTTGKVQLYVQPRAKTPQFLSLATPLELKGSFDDFQVGVRAADVIETVGQLVTSVIWVPLQSLFGKSIPVDGQDVCGMVALK